ncbi:MAG: hypothetical protein KJ065_26200 [Anaerolineae bacterium]|nr:hypothetical protein [Anaerolineae bacterium]
MAELTILELGESVVQALIGVQRTLARSADEAGRYLMDEVELDMPVKLRIGPDEQVLVSPSEGDEPAHQLTRVRLKLRPAEQDEAVGLPLPAGTDRPLTVLPDLAQTVIQRLNALRIFSIGDFLRGTSTVRGYEMMMHLDMDFDLDKAIDQAKLVASPEMPYVLAEDLLQHGVNSRLEFAKLTSGQLKSAVSDRLVEIMGMDEIVRIQAVIRQQSDVIFAGVGRRPSKSNSDKPTGETGNS